MNTSLRSSRDHQVGFGQIGLLSSTDLLLWISSTECMPPLLLDDLWLVDEENKDRGHGTEDTRTTAVKIKGLLLFVFMNLNCCWWFSLTPNIIIVNFSSCLWRDCCKQMMIFCRGTRTSGLTLYAPFLICVEIDRSLNRFLSHCCVYVAWWWFQGRSILFCLSTTNLQDIVSCSNRSRVQQQFVQEVICNEFVWFWNK